MSCGRIRRELLWLSRFGELDSDSQPHIDHLVGCRSCRDAIGVDRMMVEQLRIALATRVANASPPAGAWERILARAQAPNRGPLARLGYLVRLPFARHEEHRDVRILRGRTVRVTGTPFECNSDGEIDGPVRSRTWRVQPAAYAMVVPRA